MGKHSLVEPVLQRRRLTARPAAARQSFHCQRCGRYYRETGITQICTACRIAAAHAGVFGPCPGSSGQ